MIYERSGWRIGRNMMNELRERYINDSMDIYYVNGIWI